MRQQINLYQPIFSRERKQLSSMALLSGVGVVVVALFAVSFYADRRVEELAQEVESMRARAAQQEQIVAKATEMHVARGNPAEIEARVKQLTENLAARKRALNVLQAGAAGQTIGFAARLEALARRHVDGLWLDGLVLSGTNGSMTLQGATLNADTVPTYLQGLAHERALAGTRFDDFVIERPTADAQAQLSESDGEDGEAPKPKASVTDKHIRFRAGSKALTPVQTGATI
jgi:hypothetical protein